MRSTGLQIAELERDCAHFTRAAGERWYERDDVRYRLDVGQQDVPGIDTGVVGDLHRDGVLAGEAGCVELALDRLDRGGHARAAGVVDHDIADAILGLHRAYAVKVDEVPGGRDGRKRVARLGGPLESVDILYGTAQDQELVAGGPEIVIAVVADPAGGVGADARPTDADEEIADGRGPDARNQFVFEVARAMPVRSPGDPGPGPDIGQHVPLGEHHSSLRRKADVRNWVRPFHAGEARHADLELAGVGNEFPGPIDGHRPDLVLLRGDRTTTIFDPDAVVQPVFESLDGPHALTRGHEPDGIASLGAAQPDRFGDVVEGAQTRARRGEPVDPTVLEVRHVECVDGAVEADVTETGSGVRQRRKSGDRAGHAIELVDRTSAAGAERGRGQGDGVPILVRQVIAAVGGRCGDVDVRRVGIVNGDAEDLTEVLFVPGVGGHGELVVQHGCAPVLAESRGVGRGITEIDQRHHKPVGIHPAGGIEWVEESRKTGGGTGTALEWQYRLGETVRA